MSPEKHPPNNVISFDEKLRERQVQHVMNVLASGVGVVDDIGEEYFELMAADPETAISQLPMYIDKMRTANVPDGTSSSYLDSISGGPNQDDLGIIFNIAAMHYEQLGLEQRESIVKSQLSYLDGINCQYSKRHVAKINDPRLLRDITINEPMYWPGLDAELDFFDTHPDIGAYHKFVESCGSLGLLGYTVILQECAASLPIRRDFKMYSPELLDGVLDFAAARAFHIGARRCDESGTNIVDEIEAFLTSQFDPEYHDVIRQKIAAADWFHLSKKADSFSPSSDLRLEYDDGNLVPVASE